MAEKLLLCIVDFLCDEIDALLCLRVVSRTFFRLSTVKWTIGTMNVLPEVQTLVSTNLNAYNPASSYIEMADATTACAGTTYMAISSSTTANSSRDFARASWE
jgi:hypothetical protein